MILRLWSVAATLWLVSGTAPRVLAQASGLALEPLLDRAHGFQVLAPAGWIYDRTPFFGPGGSRGVLRGAASDGRGTLQVLLFSPPTGQTFETWFGEFRAGLTQLDGARVLRHERRSVGGREGGVLDAITTIGLDTARSVYICSAFDPRTVWVLGITGVIDPPEAGAAAPPLPPITVAMADSLQVYFDTELAARFQGALQRGRRFLRDSLAAAIPTMQIDDAERTYRISVAGTPIGYFTRRFSRQTEPGRSDAPRDGLRINEQSWRFASDGAASRTVLNLFSSLDLEMDLFEQLQTQLVTSPAPWVRRARAQCVREGDSIFITYAPDLSAPTPPPGRTQRVEDSYLSATWMRLLPALLASRPPAQSLAFHVFEAESQSLVVHEIGPAPAATQGAGASGRLHWEIREGFGPVVGQLTTDAAGHWLVFQAGETRVELAEPADIERLFGAQRAAAQQRMAGGRP